MGQLIEMAAFMQRVETANARARQDFDDIAARHEIPRFIACAQVWIYDGLGLAEVIEEVESHQSPTERPWHVGMGWVRYYQAMHDAADAARFLKLAWYQPGDGARPFLHYWVEIGRQMATPATNRQQLRWKEEHADFIGGHPNWTAAIERDRAALSSRKRKAG